MIYITDRPERYVHIGGTATGYLSRWNTVSERYHSLLYKALRRDYNVLSAGMFASPGNAAIAIWTGSEDPTDIVVGDSISIFGIPPYNGTFKILSVTPTPPNQYIIELDTPFVGNASPGASGAYVITSRKNYYLDIKLHGYKPDGFTLDFPHFGQLRAQPFKNGEIIFDVAPALQSFLSFGNCNYFKKNWRDDLRWKEFTISYQEKWKDFAGTVRYDVVSDGSGGNDAAKNQKFFAVNAVRQLNELSTNGANMAEYVPFDDVDEVIQLDPKAKFLSDFEEPTLWKGYPFSLTFINSENITNHELYRVEQKQDINKTNVGAAVDTLLDPSQNYGVNELMLEGDYDSAIKHLAVWLKIGDETEAAYYENGYADADYVEGGTITPDTAGRVTEVKTVRIKHCTYENPVFIRWFGNNGGANHYVFDKKGEYGKDHKQKEWMPFIGDIETATSTHRVYEKTNDNFLRVGASVDQNDANGLMKLREAIKIERLIGVEQAGPGVLLYRFEEIRLKPGGQSIPTPFRSGELDFIFELNQTIVQRQ